MNIDTNISNYSLAELLDITGIVYDTDINTDTIQEKTDALIQKFQKILNHLTGNYLLA